MGPVGHLLADDHARLGALLEGAMGGDAASYEAFRAGLLRHIGIEEKILLPALRAAGVEAPMAEQLRRDHGALAAMLVPTPTPALLRHMATLLRLHDPLEEGEEGLYALVDALEACDALAARAAGAPLPPVAAHYDGERAHLAIARLLARAGRPLGEY